MMKAGEYRQEAHGELPDPGQEEHCRLGRSWGGHAASNLWNPFALLGCSGDIVSRLSNRPYGASAGLLCGLIGHAKWTCSVN